MRFGISASLATLVLGIAACPAEDDGDDGAGTAPTSTTAAMSTTAGGEEEDSGDEDPTSDPSTTAATTAPMTTSSDPSEGSSGEPPGTTTDEPGTESGGMDESSTGEPIDPCAPDVSPAADACNECTKMNCCPQLQTCFDDPICVCMSGCVMGFGDFEPCADMCGQTANFMPVTDCAASMCLLECIG